MNIAAKLDRLQRHSLSGRRMDSDSAPMRASTVNASIDRLAASLGASLDCNGFVIQERTIKLDERHDVLPEPTALPQLPVGVNGDWIYIDTETTGLSSGVGNLAFVVGVARYSDSKTLSVRQYLLGDFGGEAAMLCDLIDWVGDRAILVSYNGKCFDLPLLATRLRLHRMTDRLSSRPHLDLMYAVRRAYRKVWPDCRLQTAERRRLKVRRIGDLPGAAAPAAWQAWLRSGISAPLGGVLRHNHQDVVSLALLHHALIEDYAGTVATNADLGAIGQAWVAAGQHQQAIHVWERGLCRLDSTDRLALAAAYRRAGRWNDASRLWHELHDAGMVEATLALSKYYEHRVRNYPLAMALLPSCESSECTTRMARLRAKLKSDRNLSFDLGDSISSGECNEVAGAVRDGQATADHAVAPRLQQASA